MRSPIDDTFYYVCLSVIIVFILSEITIYASGAISRITRNFDKDDSFLISGCGWNDRRLRNLNYFFIEAFHLFESYICL